MTLRDALRCDYIMKLKFSLPRIKIFAFKLKYLDLSSFWWNKSRYANKLLANVLSLIFFGKKYFLFVSV